MQIKSGKILISLMLCSLIFSPLALAQEEEESYGSYVGRKLGTGFANLATGWIELPKNAINTTNDMDTKYVIFGVIGGTIKGVLHTVGRTLTGAIDVVTFPIPTKPMIKQGYVWRAFEDDTTYGPYFRLRGSQDYPNSSQRMSY